MIEEINLTTLFIYLYSLKSFLNQKLTDSLDILNPSKYQKKITDKGLAREFRDFLERSTAEPERKTVDLGYKRVKRMGWYIESISDLRAIFIKRYHLPEDHRWTVSDEKIGRYP